MNVLSRKTSTALGLCTKWKPHCDDCFTCQSVKKLRKGLVDSKQQSRNEARCSDRQKNDSKMFTFAMFTTIKEAITIIQDEDIDISELNNELNPHLQHCLCNICGKIPKQPLTLKKCKHLFCFFCIVENIKFKPISKAICPQCQEYLLYEDSLASNKTNSLIKMLTVACISTQNKRSKYNSNKNINIFHA
ncbi:uncharacterized protein LOC136083278 [Hydra vulgaris]|uniref:Uncharacterized protein LOC136083278 n=1 Tax=Hydra vulgaris TaxID=6087 RepID=A0ABM4CAQ1_HYDVU